MENLWNSIDKESGIPFYIQLEERIRLLVHKGSLRPGDALPTVRGLAVTLRINANTVARVYRDLQAEGVLRLERGVGTFVAESAGQCLSNHDFKRLEEKVLEVAKLAKTAGMTKAELAMFVQARWKEIE
ncbi:MAG: GntR family transcriptional regulator [Myxococcota bacterium]|nr:GntR family transcriptional regulator [Myxococcota bacterium]